MIKPVIELIVPDVFSNCWVIQSNSRILVSLLNHYHLPLHYQPNEWNIDFPAFNLVMTQIVASIRRRTESKQRAASIMVEFSSDQEAPLARRDDYIRIELILIDAG